MEDYSDIYKKQQPHQFPYYSLLITVSFCLFIQCVTAYSIHLDTALHCQDGEEYLLCITSQKGKQKLVSGERECAVLFV